uniref:Src kinase-associated phosphoprotein 1 n=1 Tax=Leptobrachium leishanense TaxID=445787 RepID=A0A8C5WGA0_9ANUR
MPPRSMFNPHAAGKESQVTCCDFLPAAYELYMLQGSTFPCALPLHETVMCVQGNMADLASHPVRPIPSPALYITSRCCTWQWRMLEPRNNLDNVHVVCGGGRVSVGFWNLSQSSCPGFSCRFVLVHNLRRRRYRADLFNPSPLADDRPAAECQQFDTAAPCVELRSTGSTWRWMDLDYGFFGSEWHKRWCVLTKGSFCYYSSEKGKMPKGGFPIQGCSACLVSDIRKDSRRDACFQLMSPGNRVCQFTAPSPADAREWVDSVQFIVKDIMSPNIPCEEADDDDDESYDDVDSLSSSAALAAPLDRTDSPQDDDDIYEVVPDDEEFAHPEDPKRASDHTQSGFCVIKYEDYYQGLWNCTSDNWDELSFQRGDLIRILSKEYNAYGWWVGELDGEIGIVPKDYLSTAFDLEGM